MRLTEQMRIVLAAIAEGRRTDEHFPRYTGRLAGTRRQAHYGGLTRTLQGLRRRQLIDTDNQITVTGRLALKGGKE